MKCVFCDIVSGRLPASVVYEDDLLLGFLDIKPLFPGHVLLVPKVHHEAIWDMPDTLLTTLTKKAKVLSVAVTQAMEADGIFIANNNIVSQSVPHFHVHVVPRKKKDGLKGFFWPRQQYASDAHREEVRQRIAELCI